jgi:hypothetical protein
MNENSAQEMQVEPLTEQPEHIRSVGDSGDILRFRRGSLAGADSFATWPVEPGDDPVQLQYRDYGRQIAKIALELDGQAASIAADTNLSDTGKQAAIQAAKEDALNRAALVGEKIEKFGANVQVQISNPLPATRPYNKDEPWEWAQDAALVSMFQTMPAAERGALMADMRNGGAQRVADALLRTPRELSGVPAAQLAEIKRAAQQRLSPEPYARRDGIERSSAALAQVMRRAVSAICRAEHGVTITGSARRALLGDRARFVE